MFVHVQGRGAPCYSMPRTNLVDTLARRPKRSTKRSAAREAGQGSRRPRRRTKSIHEAVRAKERGLSKLLEYDDARRAFFQDSFRVGKGEPVSLHAYFYQLTPQREARTVSLILEPPARSLASVPGLGIRKDIRIADEGLAAACATAFATRQERYPQSPARRHRMLSTEPSRRDTVGTRKTTRGSRRRECVKIAVLDSRHLTSQCYRTPCE